MQLRSFTRERQIQKDVIETIIEVSAEEILANEPTFENKIIRNVINEKDKDKESFSNSSLHSAGKLSHAKKCLFCCKTDHYSDQCQTVTE